MYVIVLLIIPCCIIALIGLCMLAVAHAIVHREDIPVPKPVQKKRSKQKPYRW